MLLSKWIVWTGVVAGTTVGAWTNSAVAQCNSKHAKTTKVSYVSEHKDIVDTAVAAGSFKTLAAALEAADLAGALKGDGPFTVFAPTDAAFAALPAGTVESLLKPENKKQLQSILLFHVVSGSVKASQVVGLDNATSLNGQRLGIEVNSEGVQVAGANVVKTDIECSNGVIHVIDSVMLPSSKNLAETAKAAGSFGTLLAAAQAAGLVDALSNDGPFTILAPTDEAFAKVPADTLQALLRPENQAALESILKYHAIEGWVFATDAVAAVRAKTLQGDEVRFRFANGKLMAGNAAVLNNDIQASNGVIHVIDQVLMPPSGIELSKAEEKGRKVIGVYLDSIDEALAAQLDLDPHKCLLVSKLTKNGPAEHAGVQALDIIASIDGQAATEKRLKLVKSQLRVGEPVDLELIRRGKRLRLHVPIGLEKH